MSYVVRITIACDEPQCPVSITYRWVNQGGGTKTLAGYAASTKGWAIPGQAGSKDPKRAWCPDHAAGRIVERGPRERFAAECPGCERWITTKTEWKRHQGGNHERNPER